MNVLILAAGLGTRLRPLTSSIPKPMVYVVDAPILELQVRMARTLGDVVVHANAHYLAEQIEAEGKRLGLEKVWTEPEILGTAGPLSRLYRGGYRGGLLVMNCDAYCRFDLARFVAAAESSGADFALLGVDFPKVNSIRVGGDGKLSGVRNRFGSDAGEAVTFSGVSWYSDAALSRIEPGEFDILKFWEKEVADGRAPFVDMSQKDALWIDMGSPEGLKAACDARRKDLNVDSWVHGAPAQDPRFVRSVVMDSVHVPADATLTDAVLFDGAVVNPGENVVREIRGEGFCWKV
ncbi:MAG: NTP transferase domain-containing protein [Fibrobacter sp.]|nr:NTP transferase domain-containing protein [Fibrobacter sp.]